LWHCRIPSKKDNNYMVIYNNRMVFWVHLMGVILGGLVLGDLGSSRVGDKRWRLL
jgi:hypothetical protein